MAIDFGSWEAARHARGGFRASVDRRAWRRAEVRSAAERDGIGESWLVMTLNP